MLRFKPALNLAYPEYLAYMHWLAKALEGVPPEITIVKERTDQTVGDRRNYERIGLGNRLQARHQVRGLADRRVLLRNALPHQVANDNYARANGDASLYGHSCRCSRGPDGLEDGEPGKDRPLGVVLVCRRVPEIRKHPVAHILGNHAAKAFDLFGAAGVKRRDDVTLLLRVKSRGQRARPHHVAKHDRQLPTLGCRRCDGNRARNTL